MRFVRQPGVLGSADAVQRAVDGGAKTPFLVSAADTLFGRGEISSFASVFASQSAAAGALAIRTDPPPGKGRNAIRSVDGRVVALRDDDPANPWSGAPLWGIRDPVAERLCLDRAPFELENAFQSAIDDG